jgi:hypothetical protein
MKTNRPDDTTLIALCARSAAAAATDSGTGTRGNRNRISGVGAFVFFRENTFLCEYDKS